MNISDFLITVFCALGVGFLAGFLFRDVMIFVRKKLAYRLRRPKYLQQYTFEEDE